MPVIRNKRTGETIFVPDAGPQMPANPEYPYKGPQAAAGVAQTQTNTARTQQQIGQDAAMFPLERQIKELQVRKAAQDAALADPQRRKAEADAVLAEQQVANRGLTADRVSELEGNLGQINNLDETIASLQDQYKRNFAGKNPLEYLPAMLRPANGVFNDTAGRLLTQVSKAQGLTAQQFNTPAEQRMFFEPYIPKASDTDEQLQNKLSALARMAQTGRESTTKQLGRPNRGAPPRYAPGQDPRAHAMAVGNYTLEEELQRRGIGRLPPAQQAAVRADAMRRYKSNPSMQRITNAPRKPVAKVIDWNDY